MREKWVLCVGAVRVGRKRICQRKLKMDGYTEILTALMYASCCVMSNYLAPWLSQEVNTVVCVCTKR